MPWVKIDSIYASLSVCKGIFLANADLQRYQRLKMAYLQWFR